MGLLCFNSFVFLLRFHNLFLLDHVLLKLLELPIAL